MHRVSRTAQSLGQFVTAEGPVDEEFWWLSMGAVLSVGLGSIVLVTSSAARDTPPEILQLLVDQWRTMSPYDRAFLADQLSIDVATLAAAGIRAQNRSIDDAELAHELARRRYGSTLADAAYCRTTGA